MTTRRQVLQWSAGAMLASGALVPRGAAAAGDAPGFLDLPAGAIEQGDLETLPGKVPLIKRAWRPPNVCVRNSMPKASPGSWSG